MPIYEYRCPNCKKRVSIFFRSLSNVDHESARCPNCNSAGLTRLMSRVRVIRGGAKSSGDDELGDMPVFIGETGIAFDLDHRRAYRNGNFTKQIRAMQRSLRAAEDALLGYAIWNYTADNTNRDGDRWNGEDLSIFSRDQQIDPSDINSGGRALEAVIRPYPMATAGHPLGISFDPVSGRFTFIFRHIDSCTEPSLIFVPEFQYPGGFAVEISDGDYATDADRQMIIYSHSGTRREHTIMITRKT